MSADGPGWGQPADRAPEGSREEPVPAPFLGGTAVLIPPCLRVDGDRYRTKVEPLNAGGRVPRAERAKAAEALAWVCARRLEQSCLWHPCPWFNGYGPESPEAA